MLGLRHLEGAEESTDIQERLINYATSYLADSDWKVCGLLCRLATALTVGIRFDKQLRRLWDRSCRGHSDRL